VYFSAVIRKQAFANYVWIPFPQSTGKRIIKYYKRRAPLNTTLELTELNKKIGQLFMVGMPGLDLDEQTEAFIRDYRLGGIILFSRNIKDPVQVARLCRDIQKAGIKYHNLALFLAVDQEGGRVVRLRKPFTVFPGNTAIGSNPNPIEKAKAFGRVTAKEMRMVGLNMNLAPVMDVRQERSEKHLEGRTFGQDPDMVGRLGKTVIKTLQENGVMAVAKHFPGLGRAGLDPHRDLPTIALRMKEIQTINLPPFKAAIGEGVSAIMTSHAIYPALDQVWPATLSSTILTDLLRKRMGFKGLIITDDLEMGAITNQWSVPQGAALAFRAGSDILLICNEPNHFLESVALIRQQLLQNEIPLKRLSDSNDRIQKAKSTFLGRKQIIRLTKIKEYFKMHI
jgi:beta-N-acetylhexosaminidase